MPWAFKENRPIFQQIYDMIVIRILNGTYPMGGKLPSVREMAEEAGVNPNTMQRAMSQLEDTGLAITNRTSGRIVTTDEELLKRIKREYAVAAVEDFLQEMGKLGMSQEDAVYLIQDIGGEKK
ncbi:MAG: GntR family transcriptional regulator [Clostridiales bacterium]|nr:GntR family transcriptional regulator [Clostridiales bacterium]